MLNNPLFLKEPAFHMTQPALNVVFRKKTQLLPRAKRLAEAVHERPSKQLTLSWAYSRLSKALEECPGLDEFMASSVKSRGPDDNTLERNLSLLNDVARRYGPELSFIVKGDSACDKNSYVYSCGSNSAGGMVDKQAFRRSVENGFAHFAVKTRDDYDMVSSTYGLLANRLTISRFNGSTNVSLSVPGDRDSIYRYMTAHLALYFHESNGILVAVLVDSRALAKEIMAREQSIFHTMYLGDLLRARAVKSVWVIRRDDGAKTLYDCESGKSIDSRSLPCRESLRLGECPITGKCDQSKAILAVGNRFCFTSIGQEDLRENFQELGGRVPKNMSTGMISTKRQVDKWLADPDIGRFLASPTKEAKDALVERHGKIPVSYVRNDSKKTPVFLFETDVYDAGDAVSAACLFCAVLGVEKADKAAKRLAVRETKLDDQAPLHERCVREYAFKHADWPLVANATHCSNAEADVMMSIRAAHGHLSLNEKMMSAEYGKVTREYAECHPDFSGIWVGTDGRVARVLAVATPFTSLSASLREFTLVDGALEHRELPIDPGFSWSDGPLPSVDLPAALGLRDFPLIYHIGDVDSYRRILGDDATKELTR